MPKAPKGGSKIQKIVIKKTISTQESRKLIQTLQTRFEKNMNRHKGIAWTKVQEKLEANPNKLVSLFAMENTGGEPDLVSYNKKTNEYTFFDCSPESPNRRSTCFDHLGEESRIKQGIIPAGNAVDLASLMGIELLTESEYRELQTLGEFDLKTSSWIQTPTAIRKLGGALFCDRRYDTVFLYHNGAQSFYAARGFRGSVRV